MGQDRRRLGVQARVAVCVGLDKGDVDAIVVEMGILEGSGGEIQAVVGRHFVGSFGFLVGEVEHLLDVLDGLGEDFLFQADALAGFGHDESENTADQNNTDQNREPIRTENTDQNTEQIKTENRSEQIKTENTRKTDNSDHQKNSNQITPI